MTNPVATIAETCELTKFKKSRVYEMIAEGKLRSTKVGGRRLVYTDSIRDLLGVAA